MMKYIIGSLLAMAFIMVGGYYERGYWAVGAEFMVPMMAFLIYQLDEEESH